MSNDNKLHGTEIAVVGMAGRFPGARNLDAFWQNLCNGVESIRFPDDQELENLGVDPTLLRDPSYVKAVAVLDDMELFDAAFFGYTPREAQLMDPQQRVFLECAWEALENAGYDAGTCREAVGVFAGATTNTYILFNLFPNRHLLGPLDMVQVDVSSAADFLATRVSYKLNLKGPGFTVQTGCSTSLVAVHLACQSLLSEECDLALAGGVAINVKHPEGYQYMEGGIVSPDGHCRAFDAGANGTIFGSGVGIVALKRLEDALAQGDHIHAVILGSAINNDGSDKVGYTAPSVTGQVNVISEALAVAGVEADSIGYIEAHGTGTQMGDPIEIRALTRAFRLETARKNYCAIGSAKTNIGHLAGAAGVVGLIKAIMVLENRLIPPSLHFQQPSPEIDFANSPFFVNSKLTEWKTNGTPRRAGVSSFGVGGTNVHIVLEEAPASKDAAPSRHDQLLLLSAKTEAALDAATSNLAAHLKGHADLNLADAAYTLQVGRSAFSHRRMLVSNDLQDAANRLESRDPQAVFSDTPQVQERPVVFSFTGQGAQYANMTLGLYQTEPIFRKWIDTCAEALRPHLGRDLRDLLYPKPDSIQSDELNQTVYTQPVLFVIEYALAQLWISWGVHPRAMIGHSIGEYVAACLAGVFSLEDALMLVAERGRLMQSLPAGSMLAVFLPEDETLALLNAELSLAAVNGPSLCVISGPTAAVEALQRRLDEQKIDYRPLITSHAFHSSMMDPILEEFTQTVRRVKLNSPSIPYISNVSGEWIKESEATEPTYWARHLRQTVRFSDGIRQLLKDPVAFLEIGPGDTLTKLTRTHLERSALQVALSSVRHPQNGQPDGAFLLTTLGQLWLAGVQIDWRGFYGKERRYRIPLPAYPFERQRYWIEAGAQSVEVARQAVGPLYKKTDVANWFYAPVWKSARFPRPFNLDGYESGWLLFVDRDGLGEAIAAQLRAAGQRVVTVYNGDGFEKTGDETYTIDMRRREDYERLLSEAGPLPGRIVHLWSLAAEQPGQVNAERFEQAQDRGFYSVLFLAQALGKQIKEPAQLWIVSNHAQKIESVDTLYPEQATLLGLCKVISQETPNLTSRHIDVAMQSGLDKLLLAELSASSDDPIVAYRGRQRWTQTFEPSPLNVNHLPLKTLRSNGVYLITGGLSGIGLGLAAYLAKTAQARLVLSEQGETESDKEKSVQMLEGLGAQVLTLRADLTDEAQAEAAIAEAVTRFGPIQGVIHAAGTMSETAFEFLQKIDPARCQGHFLNKVYGLLTLEKIFHNQILDFRLLTSSLSTVLGGVGYAAFSAADSFLDAFAQDESNQSAWTSVNWDSWQLDEDASSISPALTGDEVGQVLQRVLDVSVTNRVIVSTTELTTRIIESSVAALRPQDQAGEALTRHARPVLSTEFIAPRTETESTVAEIWSKMLGIKDIGINDDFFELGGHSLLITQVINLVRQTFKVELPIRRLFEQATVAGVAQLIESGRGKLAEVEQKPIAERLKVAFPTEKAGLIEDYLKQKIALALNITPDKLSQDGHLDSGDLEKISIDLIFNLQQDLGIQTYPHEIPRLTSLDVFTRFVRAELDRRADPTQLATRHSLTFYTLQPYRQHTYKEAPAARPVQKNGPIAFIHSSPRAGSTLLRIMLAGHPNLFCPPELHLLYFDAMKEWHENLGFGDELTWTGQGLEWAFVEMGIEAEESQKYIDTLVEKNEPVSNVYKQLQEGAGGRLLVDKTPTYSLDPETLTRSEWLFEAPKYIHLVRHPYAVIESFIRIRLDKMFGLNMFKETDVDPYVIAETVWAIANRNLLEFLDQVDPERHYLVRYEDMVSDPRTVMTGLCNFLGIPFDEAVLNPYDGRRERMTGGLGDPNIFQHKQIDPALGEAWKKVRLPRLLDKSTVEIAAKLGYILPQEAEAQVTGRQMNNAEILANLDNLSAEEVEAMLGNLLAEDGDTNG